MRLSILILFFCLLFSYSSARQTTLSLVDDVRQSFLIESFGFRKGGVFHLKLNNFRTSAPANSTAFVLRFRDGDSTLVCSTDSDCLHTSSEIPSDSVIMTPVPTGSSYVDFSYTSRINVDGTSHLCFSNCQKKPVTFEMELQEYNYERGLAVWLSAGEASLPELYFSFSALYAITLIVWSVMLVLHSENRRLLHHFMSLVIALKMLNVVFQGMQNYYIKFHGSAQGWQYAYYVSSFLQGMLFFAVLILIGTGWSYMKPKLTSRDQNIVFAVILLQVCLNITQVILSEESPGSAGWQQWRYALYILDLACCLAVLFPIFWSIRHLKESGEDSEATARTLDRLQRFRSFYLSVVLYEYLTRILVSLILTLVPYDLTWIAQATDESATLIFFIYTGVLFQPVPRNPYLPLDSEETIATELESIPTSENEGLAATTPSSSSSSSSTAAAAASSSSSTSVTSHDIHSLAEVYSLGEELPVYTPASSSSSSSSHATSSRPAAAPSAAVGSFDFPSSPIHSKKSLPPEDAL